MVPCCMQVQLTRTDMQKKEKEKKHTHIQTNTKKKSLSLSYQSEAVSSSQCGLQSAVCAQSHGVKIGLAWELAVDSLGTVRPQDP